MDERMIALTVCKGQMVPAQGLTCFSAIEKDFQLNQTRARKTLPGQTGSVIENW